MSNYCEIAKHDMTHIEYHDHEYGFPIKDDNLLFERLSLEIMQAGLSWTLVLKKRKELKRAFSEFCINSVAKYDEHDFSRLLTNTKIIRNKLKIAAIIKNAQIIQDIQNQNGNFINWIDKHHPLSRKEWVKLFKVTFQFTGEKITGEFLMSIGYTSGAHKPECPIYKKIMLLNPPWSQ